MSYYRKLNNMGKYKYLNYRKYLNCNSRNKIKNLKKFPSKHEENFFYFSIIKSILSGLLETRVSQNGENSIFTFAIFVSFKRMEVASFWVDQAIRFFSFFVRLLVESSKLYEIVESSSVVAFI